MSEDRPAYEVDDEVRQRLERRDDQLCARVATHIGTDEDLDGWLAALWATLAPHYRPAPPFGDNRRRGPAE